MQKPYHAKALRETNKFYSETKGLEGPFVDTITTARTALLAVDVSEASACMMHLFAARAARALGLPSAPNERQIEALNNRWVREIEKGKQL